ncbi:MAG: glycosyltransferase [Oligoflexales bacterium]|nr:glycosyltransferase [Oligoflexales bacterium]
MPSRPPSPKEGEKTSLRKWRVLFWDGYGIGEEGTGIYFSAKCIAEELLRKDIAPCLIHMKKDPSRILRGLDEVTLKSWGFLDKIMRSKIVWPVRVGRYLESVYADDPTIKIFHGLSNFNVPWSIDFSKKFRTILTIHDLIPFLARDDVSMFYLMQLKYCLPKVLPVVDQIVCDSCWTKKTVVEFFPYVESKTKVVPLGFPEFKGKEVYRKDAETVGILSVSRFEKYKRFNLLCDIVKKMDGKFVLTLVTDQKGLLWARENFSDLIRKSYLIPLTSLTREDLEMKYREADVYVHTSLYEGFGLPPTEALSFGIPVVYQSGSAVDEILGKKVAFPMLLSHSIDDWIDKIKQANELSYLSDFQKKIKEEVGSWNTWSRTADQLIELYDSLADS